MNASTLRSRFRLTASRLAPGARSEQTADINGLQLGPEPDRVDRLQNANDGGYVFPHMDGYPVIGDAVPIPHIPVPRNPKTVANMDKTIDIGIAAPSTFVGSPV